jgi:hypothetical protein
MNIDNSGLVPEKEEVWVASSKVRNINKRSASPLPVFYEQPSQNFGAKEQSEKKNCETGEENKYFRWKGESLSAFKEKLLKERRALKSTLECEDNKINNKLTSLNSSKTEFKSSEIGHEEFKTGESEEEVFHGDSTVDGAVCDNVKTVCSESNTHETGKTNAFNRLKKKLFGDIGKK